MRYGLSDDTWGKEELNAAHKVIDSGRYTMGAYVKEYEKKFAGIFGSKYVVMTNSGSSSNLLMIAAMIYSGKLQRGDEVLVTAVSWSTTYFPLSQMGLKIRFIDIDDSLNINPELIEKAITSETKAIMCVNLLGNPNDYSKIQEIADKHNLFILEDNCESMGAMYGGKYAGTFGLISSFSTYFSHHLCTMEGGVCLTDSEELYHFMLAIRAHGWTRQLPYDSSIYRKNDNSFYESFNFIVPGFNLRPLEIEAATGLAQLDKLEKFIDIRRQNHGYFAEKIKEKTNFIIQREIGRSSWFGFALVLPENEAGMRNKYIETLTNNGIETRPIVAGNFTKQKALMYMDYSIYGELNHADYIHDNGFFVGNHSSEMKELIDLLVDTLRNVR